MDIEKLVKAYKKEKDRSVADRMLLIIFIQRDEMSVTGAARRLNKARSWGVKWHRRYLEDETDVHTQVLRHGATSRFYAQLINNLNLILW